MLGGNGGDNVVCLKAVNPDPRDAPSVQNGRNGVMPTWEGRFSPAVIKALAVYVHVNAGGAAEVPGVVEPAP